MPVKKRQRTYNVTLRGVFVTYVAMETQQYVPFLLSLAYMYLWTI